MNNSPHVSPLRLEMIDELAALRTQLSAWHDSFGTSQLSHALAERDRLRQENERLKGELSEGVELMQQFVAHAKADDSTIQLHKQALEVARDAIKTAIAVISNKIQVDEMLGKGTGPWLDVLNGCVSGDGLEQALTTINNVLKEGK